MVALPSPDDHRRLTLDLTVQDSGPRREVLASLLPVLVAENLHLKPKEAAVHLATSHRTKLPLGNRKQRNSKIT